MNAKTVVVKGIVEPNGTLELEGQPKLPVGPVEVLVRPLPQAPATGEDWWQYMQRTRRELEAMNYPTMTEHEVQSHIEWLRGDDDRIEEIYRQMEEHRRRQEQGSC